MSRRRRGIALGLGAILAIAGIATLVIIARSSDGDPAQIPDVEAAAPLPAVEAAAPPDAGAGAPVPVEGANRLPQPAVDKTATPRRKPPAAARKRRRAPADSTWGKTDNPF